jgi:hypothetical protein
MRIVPSKLAHILKDKFLDFQRVPDSQTMVGR